MDGQLFLDYLDMILKQEKMAPVGRADIVKTDQEAYELGDIAACEFARRTLVLRDEVSLTTVDGTRDYNLPPDFIQIARKGYDRRTGVILYTKSGETQGTLVYREPYDDFWDNDTAQEEANPDGFDIVKTPNDPVEITGSTTSAGSESNGESNLVNAAATFGDGSDLVYPRYRIRNSTSGKEYRGIVLAQTNDTTLKTAMFKDGASFGWESGDTYSIQRVVKFLLRFAYALATSGDTVKVDYYCYPPPVYSPIGMWGFPDQENILAVATYVVFYLKFRQIQEQKGGSVNTSALESDKMYLLFNDYVDKAISANRRRHWTAKTNPLMEVM